MRAKVMGRCAGGITGAAGVAGFVAGAAASGCAGVTGAGIVGGGVVWFAVGGVVGFVVDGVVGGGADGDTVGRSASANSSTESTVVGGATAPGADFIT